MPEVHVQAISGSVIFCVKALGTAKRFFAKIEALPYTAELGGSPRMCAPETWSGRERSSHTGVRAVPRIRLAIFVSVGFALCSTR